MHQRSWPLEPVLQVMAMCSLALPPRHKPPRAMYGRGGRSSRPPHACLFRVLRRPVGMPLSPVLESSRGHPVSGADDVEMGHAEAGGDAAVKQARKRTAREQAPP
jgi:hypothetical protein